MSGIHFIYVFDEPKKLAIVQDELRAILKELDEQHPELAEKARLVGMKTLSALELYPNPQNGVRLPLCRDREMLLDEPLPLIVHKKRMVQDVERYVHWLKDPDRKHMEKERILDYVHYFAWEGKPQKVPTSKQKENRSNEEKRWRKNMRKWLHDFWIEGKANGRPLNEHITVLARLAAAYGYSESELTQKLSHMVRQLPECAKSCSSRLLKGEYAKIDNVIRTTNCDLSGCGEADG